MSIQLQFRRGTTAQNDAFTGAQGEISIDDTLNYLRLHDGSTPGGHTIANTTYLGATYLPLAGGTMTGNIAMAGTQTVDGRDVSADGSTLDSHVANTSNPHTVTASQLTDFDTKLAADIHAATSKATPVDADEVAIMDSAASYVLKRLTWANIKSTLKTYFDTLFPELSTANTFSGLNTFSNLLTINKGSEALAFSGTSPYATFGVSGYAPPSFTTRSAGTKLVLFETLNASQVDCGFGIDGNTLWASVPQATAAFRHKWYAGTTDVMHLDGTGALTLNTGALSALHGASFAALSASGQITSTLAAGTAPFVVASNTEVANLNSNYLGGSTLAQVEDCDNHTDGTTNGVYTLTERSKLASITSIGSGQIITSAERTLFSHFLGTYATLTALQTAYPTGTDGDYAIVQSTSVGFYAWDTTSSAWVVVGGLTQSSADARYVISGADSSGGNIHTITTASETLSATNSGKDVLITYAGVCALTLPTATTGLNYRILANAYANTITGAAGTLLLPDGTTATTFTMPADSRTTVSLRCDDGTNWLVIPQYALVIDNTGASSDISLGIGQSAYVDFSAAASIPLHIATADKQMYEIYINAEGNTGASTGLSYLQANNTDYTNFFTVRNTYIDGSGGGVADAFANGFYIAGNYQVRSSKLTVSTATNSKTCRHETESYYNGTDMYTSTGYSVWMATASTATISDTTTAWTSLGTLKFNVAGTGRVYIKRIV